MTINIKAFFMITVLVFAGLAVWGNYTAVGVDYAEEEVEMEDIWLTDDAVDSEEGAAIAGQAVNYKGGAKISISKSMLSKISSKAVEGVDVSCPKSCYDTCSEKGKTCEAISDIACGCK